MPTTEALEFGRRLRAARAYGHRDSATEVSQAELAEAVGYDRSSIREWETGEVYPKKALRAGIIQAICDLTGLPREFFDVDFDALPKFMEQHPPLHLDWTPVRPSEDGGPPLEEAAAEAEAGLPPLESAPEPRQPGRRREAGR